jgi:hypothetical protein
MPTASIDSASALASALLFPVSLPKRIVTSRAPGSAASGRDGAAPLCGATDAVRVRSPRPAK